LKHFEFVSFVKELINSKMPTPKKPIDNWAIYFQIFNLI